MNFIDIIICIPLIWGLYKGFTKGFIVELATIVAFGLGVWGGIHFSEYLAMKMAEWFDSQNQYLPVISFALIFLIIIATVFLIAKMIQKSTDKIALSAINKLVGAVFGSLKFAMILSVTIFIVDAIEESYPMISFKTKEESLLYRPIGKIAPTIIPALDKSKVAELMPQKEDVDIDVNVKLKEK